jgi:hypothetical protein
MATPQVKEQEALAPAMQLRHNDFFRSTAEPKLVETVVTAVRGSAEPGTKVSSFGKMPIIAKPFMGADMAEMRSDDWKAFNKGSPMVVIQVLESAGKGEPSVRHIALGAAGRLGLTDEAIASAGKDGFKSLPGVEARIKAAVAEGRNRGNKVEVGAIYITRPLDCLQFVNHSLNGAGARSVRGRSGQDLTGALESPGRAVVANMDTFSDPQKARAFYSLPKQGDVVLFLKEISITVGETTGTETSYGGDHVIWIGKDGKPIPRARIEQLAKTDPESVPGTPYYVGHSALFGGTDKRTGRPLLAQSHIRAGTLAIEPMDTYVQYNGVKVGAYDAVAVISMEHFSPHGGLVASK